jgi:ferredoxin
MILTTSKAWSDIRSALDQWQLKKVIVVGCGSCAAQCQTGGTEGVKKIVQNLQKEHIQVLASIVIEEPCDARAVKQELRNIEPEIKQAEGFVVASCGGGAQTIFEVTDKPVVITTDTLLIGQTERIGIYHEKCRACGKCWLNETGGICPITACAKSLLNGPCGGVIGGKCEVGGYTRDCGWIRIYNRLQSQNQLQLFNKVRPPRDWALDYKKRDSDIRKEMKTNYACE